MDMLNQPMESLYKRLFKASPGKILVLEPDRFEIIAVTDEYLKATVTNESDIVGKTLFEVFPDDPDDPKADGVNSLFASLQRVVSLKAADVMTIQRYPIRLPSGAFEERFWSLVNSPVLDEFGMVEFIMHKVEDVTAIVHENSFSILTESTDSKSRIALQDIILQANELKQTLSKLQEHEARIRTAERMLNLGTWEYNPQTGSLNWSRQVFDIYDVAPTQKALNVEEYFAMVHPDDREASIAIYQSFIEEHAPQIAFEHRVITRDGDVRYVKGVGEFHLTPDGEIVVGCVQDITSFIRNRDKLTQAEYLLRLAGEKARLGGWRVELDPLVVTWTSETAAIHGMPAGYSPPDVATAVQFYVPEFRELIMGAFERCVQQGEAFDVICQLQTPDGRRPWIRAIGEAERDTQGKVIVVQGAFQDISTLREAQERFQLISKATNDVIWDWNFATNQVWWNDSMTDVFGYSLSSLEPGPESWTLRIHPDDRERVLQSIHQVIDGEDNYWQSDYRFIRSDGQYANVIDRGFVTRDGQGKATRMVGSLLDVTERMAMEQRLRESQKLEAVGHLTGGVAHDFNNLLTIILGNAEMLSELVTDPNLQSMAEMTLSASKRGAELTRHLLAFARRQPLDPKVTDVNQLVEAMWGLIRRTLPENIELEFIPDPDLGITEIDAGELETALLNLVVNARDAMQDGGKLTIETSTAVLDRDYADRHSEVIPGEYVMICVSDTGIGMDEDTVSQAFEPFFTTKAVGKGSGLGLSMVFGFTKQSGGHIKIYSEPGEGTSVKLYFPRAGSAQQINYQPVKELFPEGGTEHILIAEDDDLVLKHLEGQLRSLGYRVTAVTSGPDALKALSVHSDVKLLLTDIIMPGGMNGRELADQSRAIYPKLKVLFTSGYTENAIIHHGRLDPGVDLLSKPYNRLELATKVRRVLDKDLDATTYGDSSSSQDFEIFPSKSQPKIDQQNLPQRRDRN
ncbi:hybrid sensor histidine kinase/response regulator [Synechocystis sp. PCC 6714]|uniref:hybrid sensor histidine kinase/response regulator n=2 Tax=unclassified Synechocystis TaxID=2640012 RepID=UPI000412027F|nr:hybrid sensor histidine kinase/response regulator [Synechocystis sp. PCC 6714]AIE74588.1 Two-component hybrid sensor and regulator [Synechocystis sp. PCC 6714]